MAVSAVNISFQEDLLDQIDKIAQNEARTRSELIREAARIYIERKKKWESIFSYGECLSSKYKFTEDDVFDEIKKYREDKNQKTRKPENQKKIVLDANIFISSFFWGGNPRMILERIIAGRDELFISKEILDEIYDINGTAKILCR
jgi:predicted transcriptional regulator